MNHEQIRKVLDFCQAVTDWQGEPGSTLKDDTIAILTASLAEPSEPDKDLIQALTERDEYHDVADKLADGIALHFDGDIGEHSSSNSPWDRALDLLDSAACAETMRLSKQAALAEQSEPVARVMYDDDGIKTNNLIDCDLPVGTLLFTHPAPSEADELLLNLGLNPVQYRTEGGAINHLKVKAAILHPQDYPQYVKGALVIPGYESGPMVEDKP